MNNIAQFGLCKLSDEELIKRVDAGCDEMYKNRRIPDRHIPARPDDDFDLILGELLLRFSRLTEGKKGEGE